MREWFVVVSGITTRTITAEEQIDRRRRTDNRDRDKQGNRDAIEKTGQGHIHTLIHTEREKREWMKVEECEDTIRTRTVVVP
jgi:hypothetical protein